MVNSLSEFAKRTGLCWLCLLCASFPLRETLVVEAFSLSSSATSSFQNIYRKSLLNSLTSLPAATSDNDEKEKEDKKSLQNISFTIYPK